MIRLDEILSFLKKEKIDHEFKGDKELIINSFCSLYNLKNNCITWIKDKDAYNKCDLSRADNILIIMGEPLEISLTNKNISFISCDNPKQVFFSVLNNFFKQKEYKSYRSPNSIVETNAIGKDVYIGHNSYIGEDVKIGDNVIIKNSVSIEGKVTIGNNTIIHSGVVIGTDGFGYFQDEKGNNFKVPHCGGIIIGNDVEIGANTCIDKGTIDDTIIGDNVKIDNLCHIAHNVIIKENSSMAGKSNIAGSTIIGKDSWIGPSCTVSNGLVIGENCHIGLGSVVTRNLDSNVKVFGNPARVYDRKNTK